MNAVIDAALDELTTENVSMVAACRAPGRPCATHYRRHPVSPRGPVHGPPRPRRRQPRALTPAERRRVLDVLHEPRCFDKAPAQVYAELLDEGVYLCSVATMYRLLADHGETRKRRAQPTHPPRVKPELVADRPNRVWSWDITKLHGPAKWTYYYLYVIIDIYSRYIVGWMVPAARPPRSRRSCSARPSPSSRSPATAHHPRRPRQLHGLQAGRAPARRPRGVTKSHSRPRCSNDNPYSEANFKTLKYFPSFPGRFGSIEDARGFVRTFVAYYNTVHRHSGIGLLTPPTCTTAAPARSATPAPPSSSAPGSKGPKRFVRKTPTAPAARHRLDQPAPRHHSPDRPQASLNFPRNLPRIG